MKIEARYRLIANGRKTGCLPGARSWVLPLMLALVLPFCPSTVSVAEAACGIELPATVSSPRLLLESLPARSRVRVNQRVFPRAQGPFSVLLRKGVNRIRIETSSGCSQNSFLVFAPRYFVRRELRQDSVADLEFTRFVSGAVGVSESAEKAATVSQSMRETTPSFDERISLGIALFGQFLDHDISSNDQFQNGPSSNASAPVNLRNPVLDLDNLYGLGPDQEPVNYSADGMHFALVGDRPDIPRSDNGIAVIIDKRDDINGVVLQFHVLFKQFHNALVDRYLRGVAVKRLSRKQRRWVFEMVRNEVIGVFQSIVVNEFGEAFLGRSVSLDAPAISNVPVEFAAAAFRVGHSLVPNEIQIATDGSKLSITDSALRGPERVVIPWSLLIGDSAQKAARFDAKIAPVMQELLIPLSPTQPELLDFVGGDTENIGEGRVVDGSMRLDLIETNLLRGREQGLPSGEEFLAFISGEEFSPDGSETDLFRFILQEAEGNGGVYGSVGAYIFERTIAGIIVRDKQNFRSRRYSPRARRRFARFSLERVVSVVEEANQ